MSETSPVPTPLLWDVSLSGRSILCNGRIIASLLDPDDARLIVDSVNGSAALKARVKELEEAITAYYDDHQQQMLKAPTMNKGVCECEMCEAFRRIK